MSLDLIQEKAVRKLEKLNAGALFMEMGTGKTKTACDIIRTKTDYIDCVIWIAPASIVNEPGYQKEIKERSKDIRKPFHFFTTEGIGMSSGKYLEMVDIAVKNRCFCVVDESLDIKNKDSKRTERLLKIRSYFDFRLILNGTPVSKNLVDIWTQMQFLHPKILNMSEVEFAHKFLIFKPESSSSRSYMKWSQPCNEKALIEMIRPYIFDTQLDLDISVEYFDFNFSLTNAERLSYEDYKHNLLDNMLEIDTMMIYQALQQMYTISDRKIEKLKQLVGSNDDNWLIFVKYIKEIEIIEELFGDQVVVYSGDRKDDLSRISKDKRIIVMTYGTGSRGLNITSCKNVVFFSQTFDWKQKAHGLARSVRTGQTENVNCYNFWVKTGLENIIRFSLDKKEDTAYNIKRFIENNDIKSL